MRRWDTRGSHDTVHRCTRTYHRKARIYVVLFRAPKITRDVCVQWRLLEMSSEVTYAKWGPFPGLAGTNNPAVVTRCFSRGGSQCKVLSRYLYPVRLLNASPRVKLPSPVCGKGGLISIRMRINPGLKGTMLPNRCPH